MCMADGRTNRTTGRPLKARARQVSVTVPVAMAVLLSACGGETEPAAGADVSQSTISATTTPTVPAETTTTIDFDRPVTQQLTLLPDDNTIAEFAEIVGDMRGQSNQVSEQMKRIAEFASLPSPAGAQILDFSIQVVPLVEDGFAISSVVEFRLPGEPAVVSTFLEEELRALSWFKSSESTVQSNGIEVDALVFRLPGVPGDETELVTSVGAVPGATIVTYDYQTRLPAQDQSFNRLQAWQNGLRTPGSAEVVEASVRTADDIATLAVVQTLNAETAAEAREVVAALVRDNEFTVLTSQDSGDTTAPLLLETEDGEQLTLDFAQTNDPDVVEMTVTHTFGLEPVG